MWSENWGEMIWGGATAVPLMGPFGFLAMATCFLVGGWVMQSRLRSRSLTLLAGTALLVAPVVAIAAVTLPHGFTNGTVADADEVNANFSAIADALNGQTILRGTVSGFNGAVSGSGFSGSRGDVGLYTLTYDTPFASTPTVMVTIRSDDDSIGMIATSSASGVTISTYDVGAADWADRNFDVLIVGPSS